ncbi:polysaccharide deacetylase [Micromonospora craterilacus]|uniref:Polysaccharide deacetylase n=1 Tax=Micromonospora craterilacus TaxID=1655439 RepID=A0A2W2EFA4_9ACTN|nr:polysaccharide deacetylase family protein [Micromonospora craterilacus]PZG08107.1 polysaccharide deacetylase [Micromonospora craterilacus]
MLGSTYGLGRNLVLESPRRSAAAVVDSLAIADQPPGPLQPPSSTQVLGSQPRLPRDDADYSPRPETSTTQGPPGPQRTTGTSDVALTFDDGPNPDYTPQVLAILREYHVTATFCVVGQNAEAYPWLIQQIVAEGHTLCNHSWDHDMALGSRSPARIHSDLLRTNTAIQAAVPDAPIAWYRQPGGQWTRSVMAVAENLGMASLHWTVDPSDWRTPGADRITTRVLHDVQPGSIVLLHDAGGSRQGTVDALRRVLPDLTSRFHVNALPSAN